MDALDDVGDPAGARVERGRGSIHNGVADQALANPDMSIAEILFASPRLLLWRLTMWCRLRCRLRRACPLPRAARWLYDRRRAATPLLVDRNDEFADRLTQSLPPERVSELRDEVLTDNTAALRIVEEAAARRYARHSLRRGLSIRELVECDFHQFGDRCVKVEALLPLDSEAQNGRQRASTTPRPTPAATTSPTCSAPSTSRAA